jgi:hypothetical protein
VDVISTITASCVRPDVVLDPGRTIGEACEAIGITDDTCSRRRKQYGGLNVDRAR